MFSPLRLGGATVSASLTGGGTAGMGDPGGVKLLPEKAVSFTLEAVLEELGQDSPHW